MSRTAVDPSDVRGKTNGTGKLRVTCPPGQPLIPEFRTQPSVFVIDPLLPAYLDYGPRPEHKAATRLARIDRY
jgi:hypothetical protein